MSIDCAIIGDRFMRSELFCERLAATLGERVRPRVLDLAWPDEPMRLSAEGGELQGLKEFQGEPEAVIEHVGEARVLLTHLAPLSRSMFARLPKLEMVAVARGGPVNIDMDAARDHGVRIANAPGRNASAVAEFTIGAIVAQLRNFGPGHDALRGGAFRGDLYRYDVTGRELSECVVAVIGYGEIGKRVVELLRPFGCSILVVDPHEELSDAHRAAGVRASRFDEALEAAHVVTLHARVTEETRQMIDARALARMRGDAHLINTARGPLVDYDALHEALAAGRIAGAMLETFAIEPPPADWPLLRLPNVLLTPHIAGASKLTARRAAAMAVEEARRFVDGEPPLNPCA